jgi:hypothetical protein
MPVHRWRVVRVLLLEGSSSAVVTGSTSSEAVATVDTTRSAAMVGEEKSVQVRLRWALGKAHLEAAPDFVGWWW